MKANAPEKIYRRLEGKYIKYYDYKPAKISYDEKEPTEYTRTDAFVEKALAYLNEKFYFNNLHYAVENNTFNCMEEMFDDFIKYMEE